MTGFASLTSKNQLTLPVVVVDDLSLEAGTRFWVKTVGEHIVLEKVDTLREVQGVLAKHPLSKKYSADELVRLARKKKIARLHKNDR